MTDLGAHFFNSTARAWRTDAVGAEARRFHRALPGFAPTPLHDAPSITAELGMERVLLKDESARLGLPAFKILGASYAIARAVAMRAGLRTLELDVLRAAVAAERVTLFAATDGNHGRAVARVASWLGAAATIYVPDSVTAEAKSAIVAEGASLVELALPYDDVVVRAAADAAGQSDALVIQDTAWPGYREIPQWVVDGYSTLFHEIDEALVDGGIPADLVIVPMGVGSLAQAAVVHHRSREASRRTTIVGVEPDRASGVLASLVAGELTTVGTSPTIMNGLNCGTPSSLAWAALSRGLDAALAVTDAEAANAVRDLAREGVDAGPCGAATLAAIRRIARDAELRDRLGMTDRTTAVLLITEGREANPLPREAGG